MSIRPARALVAALLTAGGLAGLGTPAPAAPTPAAVPTEAPADAPAEATGVIVGYRSSAPESTSLAAARADAATKTDEAEADGRVERRLSTGGVLVDLGEGTTEGELDAVIDEYRSDPQVAYVEPDLVMHALAAPNDTEYARQWDLFEPTGGMNVEDAWPLSTGSGQVVAVIDTGLVAHSDLTGQTVAGYDFISDATNANDGGGRDSNAADPGDGWNNGECLLQQPHTSSWHGTHVAGTIAAATNNSKGIAGIAHAAKVQPVRVLGKCGGTTSDIADAITWASGGTVSGVPANPTPADVINMSLGGQAACSSTYQNAINGAVGRGSTVVVAAGNSNANVSGFTPASCGNVIAVASTNRAGARAFYSNYGALIDISAPGGEVRNASDPAGSVTTPQNGIWSTLNTGDYGPAAENYEPYMGTSMAAPHIAGLAALMQSRTPSLTPAQVEAQIKATARPLPGACSGGCGAGIADAVAALGGGGTPTNDHSVSLNPTSRSVAAGSSTTTTVSTAVVSGSAQTLTFSATGLPAGATASFSPASVTTGGSSTATIATATTTPAGTYSVSLRATAGSTTRSATLTLTVTGGSGSACAALGNVSTGSLASGGSVNLPSFSAAAGTHRGCLDGPAGTDFDLYLQKSGFFGWSTVASGTTAAPDESITYTGTSGTYRYRIVAYAGSGAYTLGRNVT